MVCVWRELTEMEIPKEMRTRGQKRQPALQRVEGEARWDWSRKGKLAEMASIFVFREGDAGTRGPRCRYMYK